MKAYVYVSLKKSVLDPQGKTIHGALKKMGYRGIDDLRQGKYFEIALDASVSREDAQAEIERIAREVLTNPVIEEYSFRLEDTGQPENKGPKALDLNAPRAIDFTL